MRCVCCAQGDITTLAGVYTFSFLGVMTLFSVGTILLKFKRPSLPREVTVSYGTTLVGITCVSWGNFNMGLLLFRRIAVGATAGAARRMGSVQCCVY